jgi:hypothetical protein
MFCRSLHTSNDMQKADLRDVTFLIPIRIDSEERIENLKTILTYLNHHLDTNIIVCEDSVQRGLDLHKFKCIYIHHENNGVMHRTRCINKMIRKATTPIVVNYDTDVLLTRRQYETAARMVRHRDMDVCYPYDGRFYNVTANFRKPIKEFCTTKFLENLRFDTLSDIRTMHQSVGGVIFFSREAYIAGGMENENFVGWGYEDIERFYRFRTLGFNVGRIGGPLYHIEHPRHGGSSFDTSERIEQNAYECEKIMALNKQELEGYVNSWRWVNEPVIESGQNDTVSNGDESQAT